jgi:hypothetical protein
LAGNVLFIGHQALSRLEIYTSCYVMSTLLLLSVSDCFAVYSRIIYFLVPPICKARNSLDHVHERKRVRQSERVEHARVQRGEAYEATSFGGHFQTRTPGRRPVGCAWKSIVDSRDAPGLCQIRASGEIG